MERHVPESFPHPLHSVPPHHKQEEAQVLHQDCTEQSQRKTVDVGIRAIFIGNKLLIATIKIHTYRTNKFTAAQKSRTTAINVILWQLKFHVFQGKKVPGKRGQNHQVYLSPTFFHERWMARNWRTWEARSSSLSCFLRIVQFSWLFLDSSCPLTQLVACCQGSHQQTEHKEWLGTGLQITYA